MDLGVQLFGLLAGTELPAEEVFGRVRAMGYTHTEPCLALEDLGGFEKVIWPADSFDAYMEKIAAAGLAVESVHIFGKTLHTHAGTLCPLAEKRGIRAYVVKVPEKADDLLLQETAMSWMTLADALREAGRSC